MENKLDFLIEPYELAVDIEEMLRVTFDASGNAGPVELVINSLVNIIVTVIKDDLERRLNKLIPRDEGKVSDIGKMFEDFATMYGIAGLRDITYTNTIHTWEMIWEMIENHNSWELFFHRIHNAVDGNDFNLWELECISSDSGLYKLSDNGDFRLEQWYSEHVEQGKYVSATSKSDNNNDEDGFHMGT